MRFQFSINLIYLSVILGFLVIAGIILAVDNATAQEGCPPGAPILGGETAADPIIIHTPCATVCWDPPAAGTVHHYDVRLDGVVASSATDNTTELCMPQKNQAYAVSVFPVMLLSEPESVTSKITYIEWQELICEQVVIVPPNADGTCPEGSTPQ